MNPDNPSGKFGRKQRFVESMSNYELASDELRANGLFVNGIFYFSDDFDFLCGLCG